MPELSVGILGATSMVAKSLLPLLADAGWHVAAYSRQHLKQDPPARQDTLIDFRPLGTTGPDQLPSLVAQEEEITHWVCMTPIWVLPAYFSLLTAYQARRVVALSSTSIITRQNSPDPVEKNTADQLRKGEQRFIAWAEINEIEWVILRPTLIYGLGRDRNVSEIARFISRFGFFPLFGAARGLRQPVHVEDVATACVAALQRAQASNRTYNLSGAEKLAYREMVARVFRAMAKQERFVTIPLSIFHLLTACLKAWPGFRSRLAMANRMNVDMVFDHADAVRDLNFSPRAFQPQKNDLPTHGAHVCE